MVKRSRARNADPPALVVAHVRHALSSVVLVALLAPAISARADGNASAARSPPSLATPQVIPVKSTTTAPSPSPPPPSSPARTGEPPSDHPTSPGAPELHFEPKSPDYKVSLVLEDAELSELVRTIGQLTGRRFIVASPHAKGLKATLFAPEKVTVAEAYEAFLAVLQANALTVIPSGAFWKIVDTQDVAKQATPVVLLDEGATREERYVTHVLRLHHVNADDIAANVLSKFTTRDAAVVPYAPGNLLILTDTGENIRRMQRILEDVDVAQPGDKVWMVPLFYVAAADIQKKLAEVFDLKASAKPGGLPGGDRLTRLVALDRPNSLLVVGSEASYHRVLAFLERIDIPVASEGAIHVVLLEHSDAKKIVPAINEALQSAGPSGAAAKGANGAEPLALLDSQVKVSAEETTNSILVTSSEHDFAAVRDVIAKLDKPKRQVYIDVVVMDVTLQRDTNIGVQWHGIGGLGSNGTSVYGGMNALNSIGQPLTAAASAASDTTLQALALGIRGPTMTAFGESIPAFGAFIEASAHTLDSDILQTPHILATDNVPSEFHVTVNRSLQQNAQSYSSLTGATGASSSFLGTAPALNNYKPLGPQIKITPHVNESDDVRLDIIETISDTTGIPEGTLGTLPFTERGATTTLTVHDQQTCVIGGLVADKISHETVKVPLLGDIPLIGALFRRVNDTREKSDLVLVLTPYIVRDQEDMRRIVEKRMDERQELLDHQALFSDRPLRPTKTFARARGLLGLIRRAEIAAEEEMANEAKLLRPPPKTHDETAPIELPATAPASSAGETKAAASATRIEH